MLCKVGLSCHPATVATKAKQVGKDHEKELLEWKKSLEYDYEVKRGTAMLKAGIEELAYLPERPSAADVQAHLEK